MSGDDRLRDWMGNLGQRHGFLSSAPEAEPERPPSSAPDAAHAALDDEAHELHGQADELIARLRECIESDELNDYFARINSFNGRLLDPANAGNAQELRRVITDLRELVSDLEARLRESRQHGAGAATGAGGAQTAYSEQASDRPDASFEDLKGQARELFSRARDLVEETRIGISDQEYRELGQRINTFNGRINDPALQDDAQELRRVITDLLALIQDLQSRSRELDRSTSGTIADLAAGRFGEADPEVDPTASHEPAGDLSQQASARADATFEELDAEAHELHGQASELFQGLADHLDPSERADQRNRLNTVNGRLQDEANRGDAQELRRLITDLRAFVQDLRARGRELGRQ